MLRVPDGAKLWRFRSILALLDDFDRLRAALALQVRQDHDP